jgi:hypothetical protein
MRNFLLLIGYLTSLGLYAQNDPEGNQQIMESLTIEGYSINNELFAYAKSKQNPVYTVQITLKGTPENSLSKVTSAKV